MPVKLVILKIGLILLKKYKENGSKYIIEFMMKKLRFFGWLFL